MSSFIRITRIPYEEPDHLQLRVDASNGRQSALVEIYLNGTDLGHIGRGLESFPRYVGQDFLYEIGSERPEDRWAYYFRLRAFTTGSDGRGAIQLRFNNNSDLPHRELAEFCIESESVAINKLGSLFREFAKLQHEHLLWSSEENSLS